MNIGFFAKKRPMGALFSFFSPDRRKNAFFLRKAAENFKKFK